MIAIAMLFNCAFLAGNALYQAGCLLPALASFPAPKAPPSAPVARYLPHMLAIRMLGISRGI